MHARGWCLAAVLLVATSAAADPKPKTVDIKPLRDGAVVLQDADGGIYVVFAPGANETRLFYGPGGKNKSLHEQVRGGRSRNGDAWGIQVWAPLVANFEPGGVDRMADGSYRKSCGNDVNGELTELTGANASAILDTYKFLTTAMIRRPYLLARDDSGTYYYVDTIRKEYGGKGFRVFIGRKGAMKQRPLTDIASDTGGDVFSTKTGNLRIVRNAIDSTKSDVVWIKGKKRVSLVSLDTALNSPVIYKDLGIYGFIGSMCDRM